MTENKRYTSDIHRIYDDNEEIACADTMDDAEVIVDLLNEQEETINELKTRNNRQYDLLKKLSDLMYKRDWETLNDMVDEWEREDEYLRKYGG